MIKLLLNLVGKNFNIYFCRCKCNDFISLAKPRPSLGKSPWLKPLAQASAKAPGKTLGSKPLAQAPGKNPWPKPRLKTPGPSPRPKPLAQTPGASPELKMKNRNKTNLKICN